MELFNFEARNSWKPEFPVWCLFGVEVIGLNAQMSLKNSPMFRTVHLVGSDGCLFFLENDMAFFHSYTYLGGGFKYFFIFASNLGKIPILTNIFSIGLKPPTRYA